MKYTYSLIFTAISLILTLQKGYSQCNVDAFASTYSVVCGDTVKLSALGDGVTVFEEDFNDNSIAGFDNTPSGSFQTNICNSTTPDNSTYYWFGGSANSPRYLESPALDLSTGGSISFLLRFSNREGGANCEDPDAPNEGVALQYSTDGGGLGGTWIEINYWNPSPGSTVRTDYLRDWTLLPSGIPVGAQTTSTKLRWVQTANTGDPVGGYLDHWGIEDIKVEVNPPAAIYTWKHTNIPKPNGTTEPVVPVSDTSYTVYFDFAGCLDSATVNIAVANQTLNVFKNPTTPICPGQPVELTATSSYSPPSYECKGATEPCDGQFSNVNVGTGTLNDNAYYLLGKPVATGGISGCIQGQGNTDQNAQTQMIILASEMPAFLNNGGRIYNLQLNVQSSSGAYSNFSVSMGCTNLSAFPNANQASFQTGLVQVYTPKATNFINGWNNVDFDQMYEWDGVSNIVISICWGGGGAKSGNVFKTATGFNSTINTAGCNNTAGCSFNAGFTYVGGSRPSLKFGVCYRVPPDIIYTWTPSTNLTDPNNDTTTATPTATTEYTVTVRDVNLPVQCAVSKSITVQTTELGDFTPSYNGPLCIGDNLELKANIPGMATYTWNGPNGFTSNIENPAIVNNVTLADSGTYTVFVDNGAGCTNTKTILVEIFSPPTAGTASNVDLCNTDTPINLLDYITGQDAGGAWSDDDGSGALTGTPGVDPRLVNPANLPGTFDFTYTIDGNACPDASATVEVSIGRQASAGTGGDFTYCESQGTINIFDLLSDNPEIGGTWNDVNGSGQLTGDSLVLTDLGFGLYSFTYTVTSDSPCPDSSATINLTIENQANAGRDSIAQICLGSTYDLNTYLTPNTVNTGTWSELSSSGAFTPATATFNATNVPQGTYRFQYVLTSTAPCINDTAIITLNAFGPPVISNLSDACEGDNLGYRVTFRITGGDSVNYTSSYPGTISASSPYIYTSDVIPSGQSQLIEISDPIDCAIASITVVKSCNCVTDAGTMRTDTLINVCQGDAVSGIYNGGFVSDVDDTLVFYLHKGNGTSLVNPIDSAFTPDFNYNAANIVLGTTYYISAAAANNRGDNWLDRSDLCFIVAPGTPVVWRTLPDANISINPTDICPGDAATVTITSTKGTAPFDYDLTINPGGASQRLASPAVYTETINPTDTTTYTLTQIKDAYGCVSTPGKSATVNVNMAPIAQITTSQACSGAGVTYTVNLTGAGTSFDLSYANSKNTTPQSVNGISGSSIALPATDMDSNAVVNYYLLSVSDNSGSVCPGVVLDTFRLAPTPSLKMLPSDGVYCQGQAIPLNYYLTGIGPWAIDIADDKGGTYSVNVSTRSGVVNLPQPPALTPGNYTITFTNITDLGTGNNCSAAGTGSANITVNPGPLAEVKIIDPVSDTPQDQVSVCENSTSVVLVFTKTQGNGSIDVTYTINGNPGGQLTITGASASITTPNNLAPGQYNYRISNVSDNSPASCVGSGNTVTLIVNPTPTVNASIALSETEICDGDQFQMDYDVFGNGTIGFDVVNQYGEITSLTGTQATNAHNANILTPANLGANNYSITNVNDGSNPVCPGTSSSTFTVTVKSLPTASISANGPQSICVGDDFVFDITTTGDDNIRVNYSDAPGVFTGSINQPAGTYTQTVSGLPVGNYVFGLNGLTAVSAQANCTAPSPSTITVTVNALPNASPTYNPSDATCFGDDVTLEFNINPGAYPLDVYFRDNFGNSTTRTFASAANNNELITADMDKTISLDSIVDANGCVGYPNTQSPLTVHALPTATLFGNEAVCEGSPSFINVDLTGNGPFNIQYQDQNGNVFNTTVNASGISQLPHTVADTTTYQLITVTDGNTPQCNNTSASTATINIKAKPIIDILADEQSSCAPFDVNVVNLSLAPDPYGFSQCVWTLSNGTTSNNCSSFNTQLTAVGSYGLTLSITNSEGCSDSKSYPNYLRVNPDPVAAFDYSPNEPNITASLLQFYNRSTNASSFNWRIQNDVINDVNPIYQAPTEAGSIINVCLEALSSFGCMDVVCEDIVIRDLVLVYIPNSFTPDQDGINDVFLPEVSGLLDTDYQLEIYNRWGQLIFKSSDKFEAWDGTYRGEKAQSTTYTIRVKGISAIDGTSEIIEYGFLNLIR